MQSEIQDALTAGNKLEACRFAYALLAKTGGATARKKLRADLDKMGVDRHMFPPPELNKLCREVWAVLRVKPRTMTELREAVPHGDLARTLRTLDRGGFVRFHKFRYEVV